MNETNKFWFAAVDIVVLTDKTLTPIDKAVYGVLCAHADKKKRDCWPKVKTIAEEANCSVRSVHNSLKTLEARGIIKHTQRFIDNKQISSHYQLVGHDAECYSNEVCTSCTRGMQDVQTENDNHKNNNIKDSLTRGADLPTSEELPTVPETESQKDSYRPSENSFTPEDAPEIMRSTAEYLLLKTKRKTLTEKEISALRELSAHQYPSRVQKEIDRACERFVRKGNRLETLTFCYIAGALRNQPTWEEKSRSKKKSGRKTRPNGMSLTQAELDAMRPEQTEEELDRSLAILEAEMEKEGC